MRRLLSLVLALCCCLYLIFPASAADSSAEEDSIMEFVQYVSMDEYYSAWENAVPVFGYNLYGIDFETVVGYLYYLVHDQKSVGYVIVDSATHSVIEFSRGIPAYDKVPVTLSDNVPKKLYINGMPALLQGSQYMNISISGEIIDSINVESSIVPMYSPQIQTKNCIVSAISNLMWHWSINGYSALARGMTFNQVEDKVDDLMIAAGGYANANIPTTIKNYVGQKSSYSVTVTNQWYPSFTNVKNEVAYRPCLLGFAAGSPYSATVGHMTVCVGTRTVWFSKYVKVIDGWEDEIVEKAWGSYNDFMSKVVLSA